MIIDPNTRFEAMADAFYRETGQLAPGKDSPAFSESFEQRQQVYKKWLDQHGRTLAAFVNALEKLL